MVKKKGRNINKSAGCLQILLFLCDSYLFMVTLKELMELFCSLSSILCTVFLVEQVNSLSPIKYIQTNLYMSQELMTMIQLVTFQEGMILLRVEHRLVLLHLLNIKISISLTLINLGYLDCPKPGGAGIKTKRFSIYNITIFPSKSTKHGLK